MVDSFYGSVDSRPLYAAHPLPLRSASAQTKLPTWNNDVSPSPTSSATAAWSRPTKDWPSSCWKTTIGLSVNGSTARGGGTLKTAGDSFLASFEPAGAALAAAAAIQQALAVRNEGLPEERQLHIRIGIHAADVVFTDEHEGFLYHGLCQQYLVAPEAQSAGAGAATSHCTRYGRREL